MKKKNKFLGRFLRDCRVNAKESYSLSTAAMMMGFCTGVYLWRCENGINGFPVKYFRRASELYKIPLAKLIELDTKDYNASLKEYLKK